MVRDDGDDAAEEEGPGRGAGETEAQQAQPSGAATAAPRRRRRVQRWHGSTQHEITRGVAGVLKELGARLEKEQAALVKEARRQHKGSKPFDAAAEVEALVRRVEQLAQRERREDNLPVSHQSNLHTKLNSL